MFVKHLVCACQPFPVHVICFNAQIMTFTVNDRFAAVLILLTLVESNFKNRNSVD